MTDNGLQFSVRKTFGEHVHARVETLRSDLAFRAYEHARERVLRMKDLEARRLGGIYEPSTYWREELANFDYLFDASPMIIAKLRHHSYHVTGLRVYDYRTNKDAAKASFEQKRQALIDIGSRDLLVPESPLLGGFGFEIEGELYNIDTLKFYEVLIAMKRGGLLTELQAGRERHAVLEIGAGWGGFAYQLKTLCPNTTYFIVDFPELFLFSATYLMTVFPEADFCFLDEGNLEQALCGSMEADFVFIPHSLLGELTLPRLDVTINMVSFQEMTTRQVEGYVKWAFEQGCPYVYSLNRDRSSYNPELTSVSKIIAEWYRAHEVPVIPGVCYTQTALPKGASAQVRAKIAKQKGNKYKHIVGWRRYDV